MSSNYPCASQNNEGGVGVEERFLTLLCLTAAKSERERERERTNERTNDFFY